MTFSTTIIRPSPEVVYLIRHWITSAKIHIQVHDDQGAGLHFKTETLSPGITAFAIAQQTQAAIIQVEKA